MKKLIVIGRVQGVGYRYFVYHMAIDMQINGTVKNLHNGDVEIMINDEISGEKYEQFLSQLYKGSRFSDVKDIKEYYIESDKVFFDFSVIY